MDAISKISVFLEVVKQQSFSGAARVLGTTGPAVSKQIQSLESRLGVKLLRRTTRQVTLTEEGLIYSERARKALDDLNEAEWQIQALKRQPRGRLKINAPMSFGREYLAKPFAQFAKKYPEIEMEVNFDDRWIDVMGENYDVSIRIGALKDSSLVARKLADCPVKMFASPALFESAPLPTDISELSDLPAIIYTQQDQNTDWHYQDSEGHKGAVKLQRRFAANNGKMLREACLEGVGIAALPSFVVTDQINGGDLIEILPEYQASPKRGIYVLYPQNRHLSHKVRLLIDYLIEVSETFPW